MSPAPPPRLPAGFDPAVAEGLRLVVLLLEAEVQAMRGAGIPVGEDEYRGLYISEAEADRLVRASPWQRAPGSRRRTPEAEALAQELAGLVSSCSGPLGVLREMGAMSPFEVSSLLLCLACEADLATERLVAYVQDDVSKRRPRVELAVRLFSCEDERVTVRSAFDGSAALLRHRLLALHDEPGLPYTPLLARSLALEPRIAGYLLGMEGLDEALRPHAHVPGGRPCALPPLPGALESQLEALATLPARALAPPVVGLRGGDRLSVRAVAGRLAAGSGLGLLEVEIPGLAAELGLDAAAAVCLRDAVLEGSALLLAGVDQLRPEDAARLRQAVDAPGGPGLVMLAGASGTPWPGIVIDVPEPGFEARRQLWAAALGDEPGIATPDLDDIAGKFRLHTEDIAAAVQLARGRAAWRDPTAPALLLEDLYAGARTTSTPILNGLARKVPPHYGWDDIILAPDPLEQLHEMAAQVEHRHLVYETWGFDRKLAASKGLMALFAGPAGTGKTMAADVIAGALGLDLYKIDLSGVVSKYIGETEKNLASVFDEAERSNAILFFDEADALFGKRSEVKDAHDRYANIETAYLLQKMEEYAGLVVLATNMRMNLDEAFMRRFHFVVDFPMPEEAERRRIWRVSIPPALPMAGDIDFEFLARQFKFSGGNIRNIVLAAAFLAADAGEVVGMPHLMRATRREYQKLGKMVTEAEFGPYVDLVRRRPGAGLPNGPVPPGSPAMESSR
jgi:hypothetical protein